MQTESTRFIDFQPLSTEQSVRLLCYPHAGAGAHVFSPWRAALAPRFAVSAFHPPGRGLRAELPPYTELWQLIEDATDALTSGVADDRFALFGHSFGAIVVFEVARALRRRGEQGPEALFVSGRRGPRLPLTHGALDGLDDRALLVELGRHYGGVSEDLLNSPELRQSFVPPIREDMRMYQTYRCAELPPLECPVFAYAWKEDRSATAPDVGLWRHETRGDFQLRELPGDHFSLVTQRSDFLPVLMADLARLSLA